MSELIRIFIERGDLAHLALFLWAAAASFALWFALRELGAASAGIVAPPCPGRDAARRSSRRDASQNRDRTKHRALCGPGSAKRHEECRIASGTRDRHITFDRGTPMHAPLPPISRLALFP